MSDKTQEVKAEVDEEVQIPEVCGIEASKIAEETGIVPAAKHELETSFGGYFAEAQKWAEVADNIKVTDATQVHEMGLAREARLALKVVRVNAEKTRKQLKEDSLRRGKAIDGMANVLKYLIEPIESRLMDMEKFAERQESARVALLIEERTAILAEIDVDPQAYNLGWMDDATFQGIVDKAKADAAAMIEAERKAEAERVAREKAEAEERARIKVENVKLQKERDAIEAKAKAEREAAEKQRKAMEAEANVEREAREKAEAEAEALRQQERDRVAAEAKAKKTAAKAPDRVSFATYADAVAALPVPKGKTEEGKALAVKVKEQAAKFAAWIEKEVKGL